MKKTFQFPILAIISNLVVLACATSPTGRSQLMLLPDSQMNEMGIAGFNEIKKTKAIETDPKINRYVKCVAEAVAREAAGRTDTDQWDVVVFKDKTANAFALPGGKIGVHTGLLNVAKNQDQLAAVLGHEVGHVIARHGNERVSAAMAAQGAMMGLAMLGGENVKDKGWVLGLLGAGVQFGVLLPHGRAQESESDIIGLDLMANAGFDPRQSINLWENMAQASGGQNPPEFMSTHPSHSTRIDGLNEHMGEAIAKNEAAHRVGKNPRCAL